MKRIKEGVTYDTETATEVFGRNHDNEHSSAWWTLHQNRHGAFFTVVCQHDGETTDIVPLSDDQARDLLEKHANHLVEQYFGDFPEYGSAERRLTLRMPIGLARRVEKAAAARDLHVNRYIMRCLEQSVTADGLPPSIS